MADILDRCTEASERTDQAFNNMKNRLEDFDSSIADFQVARQLADEIYAINDNANALLMIRSNGGKSSSPDRFEH